MLFGLECQTTRIVLERLVAAGVEIALVCMPGPPATPLIQASARRAGGALPFVGARSAERTVTATAHRHGIDVWRIGDLRSRKVTRALGEIEADALVVACYNALIPAALYANLPLGGLNLHPSLLPDKRGPDPLFWVFHAGDEQAAMTLHRLSDRFDAGAILAQQSIPIADGISEDDLDAELAGIGADLLITFLHNPASAAEQPQDESHATSAPHADADDWVIDDSWDARHAFNFARGLAGRGEAILLRCGERDYRIVEAIGWQASPDSAALPEGVRAVTLRNGVLVARVEPAGRR